MNAGQQLNKDTTQVNSFFKGLLDDSDISSSSDL